MSEWIGETFTSDAGWNHLETLVDIGNRMAGGAGERTGAERTRDALDAVGARNAHIEEFPIQGWIRGSSAIRVGDTEQDCIALPRSPAASATGSLVDLGHGLPADFEDADIDGAVVVADTTVPSHYDRRVHRGEKYRRAVAAGASAFVFSNHVEGCLPPTGSVGGADDPIGEIPAVGVSSEVGARLLRRFEGEEASVEVEAEIGEARSGNVHAEVGPDTHEAVLLTSHVDAHDIAEGAVDNGAGTATVVEVTKALAAREADLDTRVELVAYGAEEVGLVGSAHHAERADLDELKGIVNLDGVVRERTLQFVTNGSDALADAARGVGDRFEHPVAIDPHHAPHSDHWPFVERGVPGYMVASRTDDEGRGWGHTAADTIDKLEARTLREQAVLLAALVVTLTDREFTAAHREPEEIAAALEGEGEATAMKAAGDWPYDERT